MSNNIFFQFRGTFLKVFCLIILVLYREQTTTKEGNIMDKKEQNRKRNAEFHKRLRSNPEKAKEFNRKKYEKSNYVKITLDRKGTFPNNNCLNPESCFNYKTYQYLKGKYPWMNLAVPVEMDGPLPEPRSIDVVIANILRFPPIL